MIARMACEHTVMAYAMTMHGIGVPIIGSMQRYWSRVLSSAPRQRVALRRLESNGSNTGCGKLKR